MRDKPINEADQDTLEALVDRYSVHEVLTALGTICAFKAEHVQANWQDAGLGRAWLAAGRAIGRCYSTKAVQAIS